MLNVPLCDACYFRPGATSCTQKAVNRMLYYDIEPDECQQLPEILKPDEVADFLCIHKNTVYKLIHRGELPAFRVGKSWRILQRELLKLSRTDV